MLCIQACNNRAKCEPYSKTFIKLNCLPQNARPILYIQFITYMKTSQFIALSFSTVKNRFLPLNN